MRGQFFSIGGGLCGGSRSTTGDIALLWKHVVHYLTNVAADNRQERAFLFVRLFNSPLSVVAVDCDLADW